MVATIRYPSIVPSNIENASKSGIRSGTTTTSQRTVCTSVLLFSRAGGALLRLGGAGERGRRGVNRVGLFLQNARDNRDFLLRLMPIFLLDGLAHCRDGLHSIARVN